VLEAADSMLYAAKRAGKDRIVVETPIPTPGT
jgi:PleD family two-component response regulator